MEKVDSFWIHPILANYQFYVVRTIVLNANKKIARLSTSFALVLFKRK